MACSTAFFALCPARGLQPHDYLLIKPGYFMFMRFYFTGTRPSSSSGAFLLCDNITPLKCWQPQMEQRNYLNFNECSRKKCRNLGKFCAEWHNRWEWHSSSPVFLSQTQLRIGCFTDTKSEKFKIKCPNLSFQTSNVLFSCHPLLVEDRFLSAMFLF